MSPARRIARRILPLATIVGIVLLGVAAIALNVKAAGGNVEDFIAGLLVPIGLGMLAVVVIAELSLRRKKR